MQVTYKVASVEDYADTRQRLLTLTRVKPADLIPPPKGDDDPEWEAAFDRADAMLRGDIRFKPSRSTVGIYGDVAAITESPDIRPGMYLRFTVEVVSEEALAESASVPDSSTTGPEQTGRDEL